MKESKGEIGGKGCKIIIVILLLNRRDLICVLLEMEVFLLRKRLKEDIIGGV